MNGLHARFYYRANGFTAGSSITFSLRAGGNSGNLYINMKGAAASVYDDAMYSAMTVTEVFA